MPDAAPYTSTSANTHIRDSDIHTGANIAPPFTTKDTTFTPFSTSWTGTSTGTSAGTGTGTSAGTGTGTSAATGTGTGTPPMMPKQNYFARPKILAPTTFALTYFMWVFMSYFSTHLYAYFCADWSLLGFILHPLMVVSPQCSALRWFVFHGPNVISQSFALISSVAVAMLVSLHQQQYQQQQSP